MEDIIRKAEEIEAMASSPETLGDAVRLSGELLAGADGRWTQYMNGADKTSAHGAPSRQLQEMLMLGTTHADALFRAGLYTDAYSVSLLLMLAAVREDAAALLGADMLALSFLAAMSLMQALPLLPDDDVSHLHLPHITRYLASLAYAHYVASGNAPCKWHSRSRQWLRDVMHLVETPAVDVNGHAADPLACGEILGDLLGRSQAIGIFRS